MRSRGATRMTTSRRSSLALVALALSLLAAVVIALMPGLASASTTPPGTAIYVYDSVDTSRSDASSVAEPMLSQASYWVAAGLVPDGRSGGTTGNPAPVAPSGTATNSLPVHAPGSLSAAEARSFYWQGENAIAGLGDDLAARGVGLEARALEMFETRNALRSHVRDLMADQNAANYLRRTSPNLMWDEMVARKAGQGLSATTSMRRSSTRPRPRTLGRRCVRRS